MLLNIRYSLSNDEKQMRINLNRWFSLLVKALAEVICIENNSVKWYHSIFALLNTHKTLGSNTIHPFSDMLI